ncbi:hypothetical protein [Streptomyces sp. NPDC090798]|uniref:hypothetical protein n=1 Tax=Streptomyces sp. NPDC090798 TaxID=3365968 RepID=UPI0037F80A16
MPKPYKACSCRAPGTTRLLGKRCPCLDREDHGAWYARYEVQRAPNGRRRQPRIGPYGTAQECEQALVQVLCDGPTVDEILDDYMEGLTCGDRTRDNYRRGLRYVRELIGQYRAQHLTKDDVDFMTEYLLTCGKRDGTGLAKRTVDMSVALLRAAYEVAIFRQRLRRRAIPVDADPGVITLERAA